MKNEHEKPLTAADVSWLRLAVEEAKGWRGLMIGNPDPEPLRQFDLRIKRMQLALRKVRRIHREKLDRGY